MNCPNCGGEVGEGDPFCPHCGHNLQSRRERRKLRFILMDVQDDRRFRHLASAAVIIVVIVAVLAVMLVNEGGDVGVLEPPVPEDTAPAGTLTVSDSAYIELYDGLADGTMTARINSSGELNISLSSGMSSGYDTFTWVLHDDTGGTYQAITKGTAEMTWITPAIGHYTVTVSCSSTRSDDTSVHVGRMFYYGDSHVQHIFEFEGSTYSVYSDVSLSEYLHYRDLDSDRGATDAEDAAEFVITDGGVATLASRLSDAFLRANPTESTSGERFASFVLAFVQSSFSEVPDSANHMRDTYWTYPAETLYLGTGDSGDLAVLAVSVLSAAGYDCGLAVVQDRAFAAVSMPRFTESGGAPSGFHSVRVAVDGTYYYLCEVCEEAPAGYVRDAYGYSNGRYLYYGQQAAGGITLA